MTLQANFAYSAECFSDEEIFIIKLSTNGPSRLRGGTAPLEPYAQL